MSTSLDITRRQLKATEDELELTRASANAAAKSADVAEKTVEHMRLEQRAWLGFLDVEIIGLTAGKAPELAMKLKNFGRTPGTIIELDVHYYQTAAGLEEAGVLWGDEQRFGSTEQRKGVSQEVVIPPESETMIRVPPGEIMSADDLNDIVRGEFELVVVGRIKYLDIFGRDHPTRSNFIYHPEIQRFGIDPKKNIMQ